MSAAKRTDESVRSAKEAEDTLSVEVLICNGPSFTPAAAEASSGSRSQACKVRRFRVSMYLIFSWRPVCRALRSDSR